MTDFYQLRLEAERAWLQLERDNREPLRALLLHLVDAIEELEQRALGPTRGWDLREGVSGQGKNVTVRTEPCGRCGGSHRTRDHVKAMDAIDSRPPGGA